MAWFCEMLFSPFNNSDAMPMKLSACWYSNPLGNASKMFAIQVSYKLQRRNGSLALLVYFYFSYLHKTPFRFSSDACDSIQRIVFHKSNWGKNNIFWQTKSDDWIILFTHHCSNPLKGHWHFVFRESAETSLKLYAHFISIWTKS